MAKWGEGDPRWIVEERPDAKNVNNWHWTEKNATNWSKEKLTELLTGLVIENCDAFCEILSVTRIKGEATANNRKAKLIFFYEWVIKGEWSGKLKAGDRKYKGKFEVVNLSEEHEPDEVDVNFTADNDSADALILKEVMKTVGTSVIQQQFAKYIKMLKEEYSHNVMLPTKDQPKTKTVEQMINEKVKVTKVVTESKVKTDNKPVGVKIDTKTLTLKEEFVCSSPELYRVFTDKEMVQAFTGGPARYEVEKGGQISLMDGFVTGEFLELVPNEKIIQRWRIRTWPDAHFSEVTMEFEEKDGNTVLHLKQTGIPSQEYEETVDGWRVNYWEHIKQVFGYGTHLF